MAAGWVVKVERCRCSCGWRATRALPRACPSCGASPSVESGFVRWRAGYRDASKRIHHESFARRKDAEAWLSAQTADLARGVWRDPKAGKEAFGDYLRANLASAMDLRDTSADTYRREAERYVYDSPLARLAIGGVTPKDVRAFLANMDAGAATKQKVHTIISRAFAQAVRDGIIPSNPASRPGLPKVSAKKVRVLEAGEVEAIAEAIDPRYRALVLTAAYGALRFGEVAGLRKRDFRSLERKLAITGTVVQVAGKVSWVQRAKTDGSIRVVPIPQSVAEEISAHLAAYPVASDDDLIFRAPGGGPLSRTLFRSRFWTTAVKKAKITPPPRFHDLRHTGVALAISKNVHPKVIQTWVGHAKITTTMDVYGHLYDGAQEELADALEVLRAAATAEDGKVVHADFG